MRRRKDWKKGERERETGSVVDRMEILGGHILTTTDIHTKRWAT